MTSSGGALIPLFDAVVFLTLEPSTRLARQGLRQRERRPGNECAAARSWGDLRMAWHATDEAGQEPGLHSGLAEPGARLAEKPRQAPSRDYDADAHVDGCSISEQVFAVPVTLHDAEKRVLARAATQFEEVRSNEHRRSAEAARRSQLAEVRSDLTGCSVDGVMTANSTIRRQVIRAAGALLLLVAACSSGGGGGRAGTYSHPEEGVITLSSDGTGTWKQGGDQEPFRFKWTDDGSDITLTTDGPDVRARIVDGDLVLPHELFSGNEDVTFKRT